MAKIVEIAGLYLWGGGGGHTQIHMGTVKDCWIATKNGTESCWEENQKLYCIFQSRSGGMVRDEGMQNVLWSGAVDPYLL